MSDSEARRALKDKILAEGDATPSADAPTLEEAVKIAASREQEVKSDDQV